MNTQPYQTPPQWWPPKLSPWWVRLCSPTRRRILRKGQRIVEIEVLGAEPVRAALDAGSGVLITPNHSFHYDSFVLFHAAEQLGRPVYVLTAWQVFAMTNRFDRWSMQRHGCFSIDRESADRQAFKQAVEIVRESPNPLVVFAEGDIYHANDRVFPFRDGAAAIALSAAKRAERPVYCVPCAMKCRYLDDPTPELVEAMSRLEARLFWRPRPELPLAERIYRFSEGLLGLKETEHLGRPQPGTVPERRAGLSEAILKRLEERHKVAVRDPGVPERVKELRQRIIKQLEADDTPADRLASLSRDMDDLFLVTQLYSHPGDYVVERPSVERIAETIDKFEEDVLGLDYPGVRGTRKATVRFGEPIEVPRERQGKDSIAQWTEKLQSAVQVMLDAM